MSFNQSKRHFSRIPFDANTLILSEDSKHRWPCTLFDISLNGALTSLPDGWNGQPGDNYRLELQLGSKHEEALRLHMNVEVSHIENDHVGFQVLEMDIDTANHLHRLVELNTGDSNILKRELAELIKQKKHLHPEE
ncbi:MAG: PilZ domain-containing protein [Gammaproteobacteria bacterium]|nr:PilZ domain-containing protein [Gammaproteobacteria bacterium]